MKDAKGHGSEAKNAGDHIRDAASNALKNGPGHDSVRASLQDAAAAELLRVGGNPKSVPVPVHSGASGYNRESVNQAIASSNRAGRRIGGKEASAIHRLLRGRH